MCCSLTYREGARTIVIKGFQDVQSAAKHAENQEISRFFIKVTPED